MSEISAQRLPDPDIEALLVDFLVVTIVSKVYYVLGISFVFKEFVFHVLLYRPKGHDSVKGKNTLGKSPWIPNAAWTVSPVARVQPALDSLRRSPSVMWRRKKVPAVASSALQPAFVGTDKMTGCYEAFCHGKRLILANI